MLSMTMRTTVVDCSRLTSIAASANRLGSDVLFKVVRCSRETSTKCGLGPCNITILLLVNTSITDLVHFLSKLAAVPSPH